MDLFRNWFRPMCDPWGEMSQTFVGSRHLASFFRSFLSLSLSLYIYVYVSVLFVWIIFHWLVAIFLLFERFMTFDGLHFDIIDVEHCQFEHTYTHRHIDTHTNFCLFTGKFSIHTNWINKMPTLHDNQKAFSHLLQLKITHHAIFITIRHIFTLTQSLFR